MAVELRCIEQGHTDKRWMLDMGGPKAVLKTLAGQVVMEFAVHEAQKRFRLPGLAEDARHFAIALDEQTIRFAVDPMALQQIEKYLNQPASGGPRKSQHPMASAPVMRISQLQPYGADEFSTGKRRSGGRFFGRFMMLMIFVMAAGHAVMQGMQLFKALGAEEPVAVMTWLPMALGIAVGGILALGSLGGVFASGDQT